MQQVENTAQLYLRTEVSKMQKSVLGMCGLGRNVMTKVIYAIQNISGDDMDLASEYLDADAHNTDLDARPTPGERVKPEEYRWPTVFSERG